jgi:hypothetical protein
MRNKSKKKIASKTKVTSAAQKKPLGSGPFRRLPLPDGSPTFLYEGSYGDQGTATFIRQHRRPLIQQIGNARKFWVRLTEAGQIATPETILSDFDEIRFLCGPQQVREYIAPDGLKQHYAESSAADEMLNVHFRDYTSLARISRKR